MEEREEKRSKNVISASDELQPDPTEKLRSTKYIPKCVPA